ncbi:hypothetical protein D3C76_1125450 [compost metagenome]
MQFIEAQGADNDDIPVVIIAVWRRAFRQAGIRRLHQNNFVGGDAGAEDAPQFQQRAGEHHRQRFALTRTEALAIAGGFFRVSQQVRVTNQARQFVNESVVILCANRRHLPLLVVGQISRCKA